jgi:hypothetical protein
MSAFRIARFGGAGLLAATLLGSPLCRVCRAEEPTPRPTSEPAGAALRREVSELGLVALVRAAFREETPKASPAFHATAANAKAALWANSIDDAVGAGGLVLLRESAKADREGARAAVVPLGPIATIGHGEADDDGNAFAEGRGHVPGIHLARAPIFHFASSARSRIPPETIQRIVRQSFGRFRVCYESALRRDPRLEGRIAVRFTINPAGEVSVASDSGSDLPDPGVVACVVRGFASLTFPPFSDGIVTVVYPLAFAPEAAPAAPTLKP